MFTACLISIILGPNFSDKPEIGSVVKEFQFKDIRYLPRTLADFKEKKGYVLAFVDTSCPVAQKYLPILSRMQTEYRDKGIQFIGVNASENESILQMASQGVELDLSFPLVKDFTGEVAKAVGAQRVPEVVLLDAGRKLLYRGRVDDQFRLGGTKPTADRHDLKEAIQSLLEGKPIQVSETPVDGCVLHLPEPVKPSSTLTYAEHVEPIIRKHCAECHRPGTAAPFYLLTYDQVRAKAKTVADVVTDQRMPPWFASPSHGKFTNERVLSDEEKQTLLAWALGSRESGDLKRIPELPRAWTAPPDWLIPTPDLVLKTATYSLPPTGDIAYKYAVLPHVFAEETWVDAVEIKPENGKLVHHANLAYFVLGESFKVQNLITGYVPGGAPLHLDKQTASRIPKGAMLILQIHFVPSGKEEETHIKIGLHHARGEVNRQLRFHLFVDHRFAIPPDTESHKVTARWKVPQDIEAIGFFSHMHLRGKDMTFTAKRPQQKTETLLMIPNYNFEWQIQYHTPPDSLKLPSGTQMECIVHYDNSAFNPYNPNPKATVKDGPQTRDEMMNGFFFYTNAGEQLKLKMDGVTGRVKK